MKHENVRNIFNRTYNEFYRVYKDAEKTDQVWETIVQHSKKIFGEFKNEKEGELCKHILLELISLWEIEQKEKVSVNQTGKKKLE